MTRLFVPWREVGFLDRPNRFLIHVDIDGRPEAVHCPNPGRMREFLIPGRRVIIERSGSGPRKTAYTLAAISHGGSIVPLISHRANRLFEDLLLPRLFPDSCGFEREVLRGSSRFDFRVLRPSGGVLVEVKACTLVHAGVAMFPDAPTERGRKHLEALNRSEEEAAVVFVIMNPTARVFVPNIHTDPAFCRTLIDVSASVRFFAASVRTDPQGRAEIENIQVPVDLGRASILLENDKGAYLLSVEIKNDTEIRCGSLGNNNFPRGHYVYVGSAMGSLTKRINRHKAKRKKLRWHIDYITVRADRITAFPIRSVTKLECPLARSLGAAAEGSVQGFGSSDCRCPSHLFYFSASPLHNPRFVDILMDFRHLRALGK